MPRDENPIRMNKIPRNQLSNMLTYLYTFNWVKVQLTFADGNIVVIESLKWVFFLDDSDLSIYLRL